MTTHSCTPQTACMTRPDPIHVTAACVLAPLPLQRSRAGAWQSYRGAGTEEVGRLRREQGRRACQAPLQQLQPCALSTHAPGEQAGLAGEERQHDEMPCPARAPLPLPSASRASARWGTPLPALCCRPPRAGGCHPAAAVPTACACRALLLRVQKQLFRQGQDGALRAARGTAAAPCPCGSSGRRRRCQPPGSKCSVRSAPQPSSPHAEAPQGC